MKTVLKLSFVRTLSWANPIKIQTIHLNLQIFISSQTKIQIIWTPFTYDLRGKKYEILVIDVKHPMHGIIRTISYNLHVLK